MTAATNLSLPETVAVGKAVGRTSHGELAAAETTMQSACFGPAGLHTTARELQTCTFEGPGLQKHTTDIQREDPQRQREKERKWEREREQQRAKFWAVRRRGVWRTIFFKKKKSLKKSKIHEPCAEIKKEQKIKNQKKSKNQQNKNQKKKKQTNKNKKRKKDIKDLNKKEKQTTKYRRGGGVGRVVTSSQTSN